jgi:hypothetical protein
MDGYHVHLMGHNMDEITNGGSVEICISGTGLRVGILAGTRTNRSAIPFSSGMVRLPIIRAKSIKVRERRVHVTRPH